MSTGHDDLDAWKRQRTVTLAFELADSGHYENFGDIAYALQFERGLSTVQAFIGDPDMRRRLNERCGNAREALAPAPADPLVPLMPPVPPVPPVPPRGAPSVAPAAAVPTPAPSLPRRAAAALWRLGARAVKPVDAGDLESAAS